MKRQLLIPIFILLFLAIGTVLVVLFGRGYRFGLDGGKPEFSTTGLLVATSLPDGASVYINDHLTTATDNTLNLLPGVYDVRIVKEGYFPWQKKIPIEKEVVSKAEALLFPTTPKLEGITALGVSNPVIDPSFTRIAYTTASQSARKNGVYVLDMSTRPVLTLQSAATQITDDTLDRFSNTILEWSPDGKKLLATITQGGRSTTYLLDASGMNQNPADVTLTLSTIRAQWEAELAEKEQSRIAGLKPVLKKVISANFDILAWSYDDSKILYTASGSATLPIIIKPPLIGTNPTPQERNITKDSVYVYDIKEDKNYKIQADVPQSLAIPSEEETSAVEEPQGEPSKYPLSWFSDSRHLIYVHDKKIDILEYDNANITTIFALPFIDSYVFPWPNGSKIVILTNLGNPDLSPNLYTIGLK